jgi:hypothetical protein
MDLPTPKVALENERNRDEKVKSNYLLQCCFFWNSLAICFERRKYEWKQTNHKKYFWSRNTLRERNWEIPIT